MNYGLYLSANGVMANSYRQDVIANNLANTETVGFKRDLTCFRQRLTQAQEERDQARTNPLMEPIGGGMLAHPGALDVSQGDLETTGNNLDLAIFGQGYLAVSDGSDTRITRDGRLSIDRKGNLVMTGNPNHKVLGQDMKPIQLDGSDATGINVGAHGELTQNGKLVATLGMFEPKDPAALQKIGGNLFATNVNQLKTATGQIQSGFVERSNVDPTTELAALMDAQRQLEANANMIRYQDQTLGRLVNDVGKMN